MGGDRTVTDVIQPKNNITPWFNLYEAVDWSAIDGITWNFTDI